MEALGSAPATLAGQVITFFIAPVLVGITTFAGIGWIKTKRALKTAAASVLAAQAARDVVAATAQAKLDARLDTQDRGLETILQILSPPGAPTLAVTIARIDAEVDASKLRLTEHIQDSQAAKADLERRLSEKSKG